MAVAETPVAEKTARSTQNMLGITSLLSGALALLGLWLVFGGFPYFWNEILIDPLKVNDFLSGALLLICSLVMIAGLWYFGIQQLNRVGLPGLRAGTFYAAIGIYIGLWLIFGVGGAASSNGALLGILGGVLFLGLTTWAFTRHGFMKWLVEHEASGWFSGTSFKGTQGVRVRRCTIIGVLTLGLCGIYSLVSHRSFGQDRIEVQGNQRVEIRNDYYWKVPFTTKEEDLGKTDKKDATTTLPASSSSYLYIPILNKVHIILPILFSVALIWFAWRLVNQPTFADFLIATEAEMNKVSWTTRKRLVQDTIVVLVTVFLMTIFLFAIDLLWIKVLSTVGVLHVDPRAQQQKQREKSQW